VSVPTPNCRRRWRIPKAGEKPETKSWGPQRRGEGVLKGKGSKTSSPTKLILLWILTYMISFGREWKEKHFHAEGTA